MHSVAVAVTPGAPLFETSVAFEVFGMSPPDGVAVWYEVRACAVGNGPIRLASGFVLDGHHGIDDLVGADTVIVPAAPELEAPPALAEAVRTAHDRGARLASICSGAFVLAAAGLLDGRRATTHWRYAAELARRHPSIVVDPAVLYVEDGGIFTSAGTAAGLDLCLELVRRDHGAAAANAVARRLVVPPHRDGGQAQYVATAVPTGDQLGIAPLLEWALGRIDRPITVADLAAQAHMSPRTLVRRFGDATGTTPLRWLTMQRIRLAQQLLETTEIPVERVAGLSGLGSPANFRSRFRQTLGVTPSAYRQTFRTPGRTPGPRP
jgi:transcriptional regulator GlxA family with amidase domain